MNTHELLQADRKIWNEVSSLHAEGWTLDEALHEMTCVRRDVHALLQPCARPPTQKEGKGGKGKPGKDNGKKGSGKVQTRLKDDGKTSALSKAMRNLQLKHGNARGQSATTATATPRHPPFQRQACGQRHPALQIASRQVKRCRPSASGACNLTNAEGSKQGRPGGGGGGRTLKA